MDPNECWAAIISAMVNPDRDEVDREQLTVDLRTLADWIEQGGKLPNVYQ